MLNIMSPQHGRPLNKEDELPTLAIQCQSFASGSKYAAVANFSSAQPYIHGKMCGPLFKFSGSGLAELC